MKLVSTCAVLGLVALAAYPTVSLGEDFLFPESWEGVWETTFTEWDCVTEVVTDEGVDVDGICAGDPFTPEFGDEVDMQCTGSVSDSGANIDCSYSETIEGCTVTFRYVTEANKSGDTITGNATTSITYEGDCIFVEDMCWYEEFTAERLVGEDPGCSGTPVTTQSWGVLKDHYR